MRRFGIVVFVLILLCGSAFAADFSSSTLVGNAPLSTSFTGSADNSPTTYLWDFGDGTTSKEQDPTHVYAFPGRYNVTFSATGTNVWSYFQFRVHLGPIDVSLGKKSLLPPKADTEKCSA